MQAMDLLCNYKSDMTRQFWKDRYAGVFRANSAMRPWTTALTFLPRKLATN